ncbi:MAG TPA: ImmA/IrrE family metallo-endopeptidase [Planctomycetota bacterium]|jgi:Zn-dependent peptidase ImmA (M78 family)/DNA-binding XRE family transcriptional regulator|nr:ImmA/IrrE family metallo-endopeptidase [Planctomycetota bacterium]NMD34689.1 ImmA/IrrE family metallo-endopeptidase [Planctomycetota bacterium]HNR99357.1 ImmA/IrrE family metallo-endopeptidase [Planctomycetota bacterium]HNU26825.1 ImmA/IrrE family metallo-endopeptidase [Planctomycetota bacterium]HOE30049.1 ImmA/IrrE family metallo-endopeptidase [Planctomycetota bacterium]
MIGARIRQARLGAAMTQDEVVAALTAAGEVTLTKAGLSKYERGGSIPKPTMLRAIARVVGVSTAFLLEEPSVSIQWLAFRKGSKLGKSQQKQIEAVAASRVEAFVTLRRRLEPQREYRKTKRATARSPEEAERAAEMLREQWRLGEQPIESVTSVIEDNGGIVVEVGGEEDVFDGLSGFADDTIPVVVVSPAVSDDRRRFSLAHELAHLFVDSGEADQKTQERIAHRFAAAFLVPAAAVRRELGEKRRHLDFHELAILKQKHGLSMQAWIMRAADLGIIDEAHARNLFAGLSAKGWRKEEPVKFEGREKPLRLRQLTVRGVSEGVLTRTEAERICPQALADIEVECRSVRTIMDARVLLKLPKAERDRLLKQAAELVEGEYQKGGSLTGFDALSEEDHRDKPVED